MIHPPFVHDFERRLRAARKCGKIAVRRPQFTHAVMQAKCGDPRVVDPRAGQFRRQRKFAELLEI